MATKSPTPRDIRALMQVFGRFQSARLWSEIPSDAPVALRFEGDDEPWFAVVMGSAGIEFGVHMIQGLPGLRALRARESDDDIEEIRAEVEQGTRIGFSIERWSNLPPGQRRRLQRGGVNPRREASVPFVAAAERGRSGAPDARALRRLVLATAVLLDAHERSLIPWHERPDPDTCAVLEIAGPWRSPCIAVSWHDFGVPRRTRDPHGIGWKPPPPPPETARWRTAESAVTRRTMRRLDERELLDDDALLAYFGTTDMAAIAEFLGARPDAHPALYHWLIENVRRPRRAPTVLESLLDDDLTDDERAVVEARRRATPVFARVATTDPETGWITAVDILTGEPLRFHDWGVSQSTAQDQVIIVTPVRVADVILPLLAGPLLARGQADEAFAFLEQQGLVPTPEGIAKKPHLLGRLWLWLEELRRAPPPRVHNTDGEPMEFHELVLRAADPGAVIAALERRDDIDYDEHEGHWSWFRENDPEGRHAMLGSCIHLGRIQVIGDEILVSVNSAGRARRVRAWLEDIPGVGFEKMEVSSLDAVRKSLGDRPLDDRPSDEERNFEPPPEVLEQLARHLRAQYRNWMGERIPALGGKTPRQAVRSKKGRAQVLRLIHTLPSPMDGIDMEPIRQELLRELGLE